MAVDTSAPEVRDWLSQFSLADQPVASRLLDSIVTVSANAFTREMTEALSQFMAANPGPIGLYTERPIRRWRGEPNRLFRETRTKRKRAFGSGPQTVPAGRADARDTGSEGLIATLISGWVRNDGARLFNHPGPDQIRASQIRHHLVVTDFIGSGKRACDNLDSVWRLSSSKSWRSYGLMSYGVLAYSGVDRGVQIVERHRSMPNVYLRRGCPVVSQLAAQEVHLIKELLWRYGPRPRSDFKTPLGYQDGGALMLFDHGMPNNAPLILHERTKSWTPLFPKRSTVTQRFRKGRGERPEDISKALMGLREKRLAESPRLGDLALDIQDRVLVLACLKRRPRMPLVISARTNLPISAVEAILARAQNDGLVDGRLKLTEQAYQTFEYLRRSDPVKPPLVKANNSFYCPKALRSPRRTV